MMMRRRPLLRAAAVGGTAYMAGKHTARQQDERAANEAYQNQQIADLQAAQAQPAAAPPDAAPASTINFDELQKLGEMHQSGILTDEEFEAAKKKVLGNL